MIALQPVLRLYQVPGDSFDDEFDDEDDDEEELEEEDQPEAEA